MIRRFERQRGMRVLITGFPPFLGSPLNPTQQLIDAIRAGRLATSQEDEIHAELLPVEYQGVEQMFDQLRAKLKPELILSFGVGRHQATIRFESLGVNLDDALIQDNSGEQRSNMPILVRGPDQIDSPVDLGSLAESLARAGIPVEISQNAGRYVCNHLLYYASYQREESRQPYQFLFSHVPTEENGFLLDQTLHATALIVSWFRT